MDILSFGIRYETGAPLVPAIDEVEFADRILESFAKRAPEMRYTTSATTHATTFRGVIERTRTADLGNPREAGWTFLISEHDPRKKDIIRILRPLAMHRSMIDPQQPLVFHGEEREEWFEWLLENYSPLETDSVPHYVLIAAGPDQVPFQFQALLDSAASVGRVDFDTLEDLEKYVNKVLRLESTDPVVSKETLFFAPDPGPPDPTYFSCHHMAVPLSQHARCTRGYATTEIMGSEATRESLLDALRHSRAAVVYTASHGLGATDQPLKIQKQYNGAICCQHTTGDEMANWLVAASDIWNDAPLAEGAVFFQFACFGYGTPAESDFSHWIGHPELNCESDFVAALPKKLLAHPRGPIAFIGHLDTAWMHGFTDPHDPYIVERWNPRIVPFKSALDCLLQARPIGLAMAEMNIRYNAGNAILTGTFDRIQRGKVKLTNELKARLAETFIWRSDAQNYMILGDPAVGLRVCA